MAMLMGHSSPTSQVKIPQQQPMLQIQTDPSGSYSPYSSLQPAYQGNFVGAAVQSPKTMQPVGNLPVTYINTTGPGGVYAPTRASPSIDGPTNSTAKQAGPGGAECKGAEAECTNQEECGGDEKPPNLDGGEVYCGIDRRTLLPPCLGATTIIGGAHMLFLTLPVLRSHGNIAASLSSAIFYSLLSLYILTMVLMIYCGIADAGQVPIDDGAEGDDELPQKAPPRSYKTWCYERPVRRFDHYCRWLRNAIGLLNHREFFAMLVCLMLIAVLGFGIDTWVFVAVVRSEHAAWGSSWNEQLSLVLVFSHVCYDLILLYCVLPIFQLHTGFISRNELAKDYNNDIYRLLKEASDGRKDVPKDELSSDEYNMQEEGNFVYDPSRNPYDKGCCENCFSFWCRARWPDDVEGNF